jgi:hypothetical protein
MLKLCQAKERIVRPVAMTYKGYVKKVFPHG